MKTIACSLLALLIGSSLAGTASADDDDHRDRYKRRHRQYESRHHYHPHYPPPRMSHRHRHEWGNATATITFGGITIGSSLPYGAPPPPRGHWFYCRSSGQYYPYTNACPEGWKAVRPY